MCCYNFDFILLYTMNINNTHTHNIILQKKLNFTSISEHNISHKCLKWLKRHICEARICPTYGRVVFHTRNCRKNTNRIVEY